MMKRIIFIVLFLFSWVLSFEQTRPNTFTEETSPTNANFEVYSQKNNLPRRASLNNLKAFFDQYIYTKTDSICISRQAGDTCVYFVPTDIDSLGVSNDTLVLYGGGDAIADLPFSRIEAVIEIGSVNITNGSVSTVDLADGSVNSAKIADGSVTTGDILDGTIATADLADALITLAKIAANAIDSTKVVNGGLSGDDLADAAITTAKIADSQITGDKIASNTIPLGDLTQISSQRLLGRYSTGIGDVQQISLGTGLAWSGSSIVATGSAFNAADSISITKTDSLVTVFLWADATKLDSASFVDQVGTDALNDLSDVVITSPTNYSALVYDSGSGNWIDANTYPRYIDNTYTFVSGITITYSLWELEPTDSLRTLIKNVSADYTFTIPDEQVWKSMLVEGTSSHLDGSGDLTIRFVSRGAIDATDNYIDMPDIMYNGQMISDWGVYGVTGTYTVTATGTVEYVFSNLGTLGGGTFGLKFNF